MTRKEELEKGLNYFKKNPHRASSIYKEMYSEDVCLTCPDPDSAMKFAFEKMYADKDTVFPTIRMHRGKVIDTHMWDESLGFPKGHFTHKNTSDELAKKFIESGYGKFFI